MITLSVPKAMLSAWEKFIKYTLVKRLIYSGDINIIHSLILFLMYGISHKKKKSITTQDCNQRDNKSDKMYYSQEN